MTTMDICYCVLILAGAFCLVALGVLFIRDPQRPKFNPLKMMMSFIKKK